MVEGAARAVPDTGQGVRIVRAEGSGDDAIVDVVGAVERDAACWVVTADRELRARCTAAGARILGPRRILDQLS